MPAAHHPGDNMAHGSGSQEYRPQFADDTARNGNRSEPGAVRPRRSAHPVSSVWVDARREGRLELHLRTRMEHVRHRRHLSGVSASVEGDAMSQMSQMVATLGVVYGDGMILGVPLGCSCAGQPEEPT